MKETKFKDTEVGRIPEDWEATRIDKLCCLKARIGWQGLTTGEYLPQGDYVLVTGTDFNDGYIDWKNCCYVSKWRYDQDINIQIKEGDVLISKDGTIGKVAFLDSIPGPGTLNSGVFVVRPKQDNVINKAYLSWIFKSIWFKSFIDQLTAGSTINHLYQKDFVKFQLVYPNDISEQSRIATALSAIDNLISELGKLIEKKRAIKQGAMQQLLTGKKRLKGFNEPWVEKKLGKLCNLFGRIGYRGYTKADLVQQGEGAISFSPSDIISNKINYDTCTYISAYKYEESPEIKVYNGDIIFCKTASIGKCALVENLKEKATINPQFVVMKNFICNNKYLYYRLIDVNFQNKVKEIVGGSTIPTMSQEKLKELILLMPSDIVEQTAIAEILSDMDKEIANLEVKKSKYEKIKQGMMLQLLTGKIRLVETSVKPNATSANVHFRRSVWAAEIAERLYEEPTFGHVKMEKILFLTERLCHIDIGSHYHRDAAGPYDNNALRSIDSQLKKQKWFEVQRTEKGYRYVPMQNCGKHKTYFNRYYSGIVPMFDKIINTFKTQNTERCEIVATLYSAWEDLLHSNKSFTDADIVNEVLNNWHESKKRISQDRWLKAIQWMRDNGFAPDMSVCMK